MFPPLSFKAYFEVRSSFHTQLFGTHCLLGAEESTRKKQQCLVSVTPEERTSPSLANTGMGDLPCRGNCSRELWCRAEKSPVPQAEDKLRGAVKRGGREDASRLEGLWLAWLKEIPKGCRQMRRHWAQHEEVNHWIPVGFSLMKSARVCST